MGTNFLSRLASIARRSDAIATGETTIQTPTRLKKYQLVKIFQGAEKPVAFNLNEHSAITLHKHIRGALAKRRQSYKGDNELFEGATYKIEEV